MNKKQKLATVMTAVVLLVAVIAGIAVYISDNYVYHNEDHKLVSTTGEKNIAPDFTVFNAENAEVRLSEHIGKKTVVSFWATWCGPCKSMLSDFNNLYEDGNQDIEFMMINLTDGIEETMDIAKEYIDNKKITVPVYYDLSYSAVHEYHVTSLPVTVFIDENGYISDIHQGKISKSQIEEYIKNIDSTNEMF